MKKIYLLSAVALLSLTACNDFEDQFHIGDQITDVKKDLPIVLEDGDYTAIANLAANKPLTLRPTRNLISSRPYNACYMLILYLLKFCRYKTKKCTCEDFISSKSAGIKFQVIPA